MRVKFTNQKKRIKKTKEILGRLQDADLDTKVELVQMLVPAGLYLVGEMLKKEVEIWAGPNRDRKRTCTRWGTNPGSVYLGDQKVAISVPRLRDRQENREISLEAYQKFQNPGQVDLAALSRVINGISQKKYEKAAIQIPSTFGISKSSVSKRFVKASGVKLRRFMERDLSRYDIVSMILDGKTFAENQIVVAMGVTITGEKLILGFIESSTENHTVCKEFLNRLIDRGLRTENAILFVIDGGKGLRKGIVDVFGESVFIQRCQWHKRENVLRYLDKKDQEHFRRKLQAAYEQPTYDKAKRLLEGIKRELRPLNISAVHSLEEGFEETLTLHRLKMFAKLGVSFKTTNCLEHVNRQLEMYTGRIGYWKSSDHRQRWVATALLELEPTLRKVKGWEFLPALRAAMRLFFTSENSVELKKAA